MNTGNPYDQFNVRYRMRLSTNIQRVNGSSIRAYPGNKPPSYIGRQMVPPQALQVTTTASSWLPPHLSWHQTLMLPDMTHSSRPNLTVNRWQTAVPSQLPNGAQHQWRSPATQPTVIQPSAPTASAPSLPQHLPTVVQPMVSREPTDVPSAVPLVPVEWPKIDPSVLELDSLSNEPADFMPQHVYEIVPDSEPGSDDVVQYPMVNTTRQLTSESPSVYVDIATDVWSAPVDAGLEPAVDCDNSATTPRKPVAHKRKRGRKRKGAKTKAPKAKTHKQQHDTFVISDSDSEEVDQLDTCNGEQVAAAAELVISDEEQEQVASDVEQVTNNIEEVIHSDEEPEVSADESDETLPADTDECGENAEGCGPSGEDTEECEENVSNNCDETGNVNNNSCNTVDNNSGHLIAEGDNVDGTGSTGGRLIGEDEDVDSPRNTSSHLIAEGEDVDSPENDHSHAAAEGDICTEHNSVDKEKVAETKAAEVGSTNRRVACDAAAASKDDGVCASSRFEIVRLGSADAPILFDMECDDDATDNSSVLRVICPSKPAVSSAVNKSADVSSAASKVVEKRRTTLNSLRAAGSAVVTSQQDSQTTSQPDKRRRSTVITIDDQPDIVIIDDKTPPTGSSKSPTKSQNYNVIDAVRNSSPVASANGQTRKLPTAAKLMKLNVKDCVNRRLNVSLETLYFRLDEHSATLHRLLGWQLDPRPEPMNQNERETLVFQCSFCPYIASSAKHIAAHIKLRHSDITSIMFQNSGYATQRNTNNLFLFCRHCDFVTFDSTIMWIHFAVFHKVAGILSSLNLPKHSSLTDKSIDGKSKATVFPFYCCRDCDKMFSDRCAAIDHAVTEHDTSPFRSCFVRLLMVGRAARRSPETYATLANDDVFVSSRKEIFACVCCGYFSFYPFFALAHHLHLHRSACMLFVCSVHGSCTRRFVIAEDALCHLQSVHASRFASVLMQCTVTLIDNSTNNPFEATFQPGRLTDADIPKNIDFKLASDADPAAVIEIDEQDEDDDEDIIFVENRTSGNKSTTGSVPNTPPVAADCVSKIPSGSVGKTSNNLNTEHCHSAKLVPVSASHSADIKSSTISVSPEPADPDNVSTTPEPHGPSNTSTVPKPISSDSMSATAVPALPTRDGLSVITEQHVSDATSTIAEALDPDEKFSEPELCGPNESSTASEPPGPDDPSTTAEPPGPVDLAAPAVLSDSTLDMLTEPAVDVQCSDDGTVVTDDFSSSTSCRQLQQQQQYSDVEPSYSDVEPIYSDVEPSDTSQERGSTDIVRTSAPHLPFLTCEMDCNSSPTVGFELTSDIEQILDDLTDSNMSSPQAALTASGSQSDVSKSISTPISSRARSLASFRFVVKELLPVVPNAASNAR